MPMTMESKIEERKTPLSQGMEGAPAPNLGAAQTLVETFSCAAHDGWMASKRANGVTSRKSETGEELMVPYAQLSESAKDLDRQAVRSVLSAIDRAGYEVRPKSSR